MNTPPSLPADSPDSSTLNTPNENSGVRLWPAIILTLIALALITFIWLREDPLRQSRIIRSFLTLICYGFSMTLWALFFARFTRAIRLRIFIIAITLAVAAPILFKIKGVSGDLLPIIVFRWSTTQSTPLQTASPQSSLPSLNTSIDYPQFLGPNRTATFPNLHLDPNWSQNPPQEIWRIPIAPAWSGFAISQNRAITQEQLGDQETVTCYEAATGKLIWRTGSLARFDTTIAGIGPRATPTIDNNHVYTMGSTGLLTCLDILTGEIIWQINTLDDTNAKPIEWGQAGSPLVNQDLVIVNPGGPNNQSLVAYNKTTGQRIWANGNAAASYASPMLATLAGIEQIISLNHQSITSHDPQTGQLFWQTPWKGNFPKVAQPLVVGADTLLVSSGYGVGAALYQISTAQTETTSDQPTFKINQLWKNIRLKSKFANMVQLDNYTYSLDDGILVCLETATGKRIWKGGRYGHGQIIRAADQLLIMAEHGAIVLVKATPDSHQELAQFQVLNSKSWNPHALAGPYLFVRNDQEAACFKLPLINEPSLIGDARGISPTQ